MAGAVLTTNCNKDDDTSSRYNADTDVVKINFTAGNKASRLTRSNPLGETTELQAAFNVGDKIAVEVTDLVEQEFVEYTHNDADNWVSDADEYLLWKTPTQTFHAVYPAEAKDGFTQPEDQSSELRIAAADYMTVSKECTRPDDDSYITLALERQTARVIVKIAGFNNQYTAEEKVVQSLEISGVTSPYVQVEQDVDPGKVGTTYTALILPGDIDKEDDGKFITLIDGQDNELYVKTAELPVDIEKGKSYTFSLIIGKDVIQVGDVTVNEWNEEFTDFSTAKALAVPTSQKSQDNLNAADLLSMKETDVNPQGGLTAEGQIPITLSHALAKLDVTIVCKRDIEWDENTLSNFKIGGSILNFSFTPSTGVVSTSGTETGYVEPFASEITQKDGDDNPATIKYEAILVPQTIAAGNLSVSFGIDGKIFEWVSSDALVLAANNQYTLSLTLDNVVNVTSITLGKPTITLTVGNEETLTIAEILPADATNKNCTWSSSNKDVATVDETGKVTAEGPGVATITVTSADGSGVTASCEVISVPVGYVDLGIRIDDKPVFWQKSNTYPQSTYNAFPEEDIANLPSQDEFNALLSDCYWVWDATNNGVYIFKAHDGHEKQTKPESEFGNYSTETDPYIFLPEQRGYLSRTTKMGSFVSVLYFSSTEMKTKTLAKTDEVSVCKAYHCE